LCDDRDFIGGFYDEKLGLENEDLAWLKQAWPGFKPKGSNADYEPTAQLPSGIPADAMVGMRHSVGHALEVSNGIGWQMAMTEEGAIISGYYKNDNGDAFLVRPTAEQRYFFTVWLMPGLAKGTEMSVIEKAKGTAKPYSELDAAIRDRMERAYKVRQGGG
jgi:hypothetical protein